MMCRTTRPSFCFFFIFIWFLVFLYSSLQLSGFTIFVSSISFSYWFCKISDGGGDESFLSFVFIQLHILFYLLAYLGVFSVALNFII